METFAGLEKSPKGFWVSSDKKNIRERKGSSLRKRRKKMKYEYCNITGILRVTLNNGFVEETQTELLPKDLSRKIVLEAANEKASQMQKEIDEFNRDFA